MDVPQKFVFGTTNPTGELTPHGRPVRIARIGRPDG
jgi:hypothetical protein